MNKLTILPQNEEDLALLVTFARRLNASILDISASREKNEGQCKGPVAYLEELAARGGIEAITDPLHWQKEIRKDRNLPNRTE